VTDSSKGQISPLNLISEDEYAESAIRDTTGFFFVQSSPLKGLETRCLHLPTPPDLPLEPKRS